MTAPDALALDASLIVPTYNRSDALLETLGALGSVQYASDRWEVIVVDDGSTDGTAGVVEAWKRGAPPRVQYLRQQNAGPAAARNRGAAAARGRILVFIDNDILVPPDFVTRHLGALETHPGSWIVGRIRNPPEMRQTPFGRYHDDLLEATHAGAGGSGPVETKGLTAANLSLPAEDFRRLGGFDASFSIASSEDWDLGFRARRDGIRILYDPGIVVTHRDWAVTLERFCERQRLYSISDGLLFRKHGDGSPHALVVHANGPVDWRRDAPAVAVKKLLKGLLATGPGRGVVHACCRLVEAAAPDTRFCRRAYDLAVALAIFRGVREGLARYAGHGA